MEYQVAMDFEIQSLLKSNYDYFDNRIDCISIKRYYKINDYTFKMLTLFSPNDNGLNTIKEGNNNMSLSEKLAAKKASASSISNPINANNGSLQSKLLKGKLTSNKSAIDKADLTSNKFAEVESLRQSIKTMQNDIINLQSEVVDFAKLALENNAFISIISKDNKSILNAINSLHGKLASNKVTIDNGNQKVITKKANTDNTVNSIQSQNLDNDAYQALYEHFKGYFNHKFAKSGTCNKLNDFKFYINGIDFSNLNTIDKSARVIWQAYKSNNNNQMIFAPNSLKLAIESLIKLGTDFDLIKDTSPNSSDNMQVNSPVKDFAYWSTLLNVDISIIQECIASLKDKDNSTYPLIKEYLSESSGNTAIDTYIDEFIKYLDSADFAG
jgi:hypothetical protein